MYDIKSIINEIKADEGFVDHIYYLDGIPHIGYGYQLRDNKLPDGIARHLNDHGFITRGHGEILIELRLKSDIRDARTHIPETTWNGLSAVRQEMIIMMIYNMGIGHFLKFKQFLFHLEAKDIPGAVKELIDSDWYRDKLTHNRAVKLIKMFQEG